MEPLLHGQGLPDLPHAPLHSLPKASRPRATLLGPSPPWLPTPYLPGPRLGWTPGDPTLGTALSLHTPPLPTPPRSALLLSCTAGSLRQAWGWGAPIHYLVRDGVKHTTEGSPGHAGADPRSHTDLPQGGGRSGTPGRGTEKASALPAVAWDPPPASAQTSGHSGHKPPPRPGAPQSHCCWEHPRPHAGATPLRGKEPNLS